MNESIIKNYAVQHWEDLKDYILHEVNSDSVFTEDDISWLCPYDITWSQTNTHNGVVIYNVFLDGILVGNFDDTY